MQNKNAKIIAIVVVGILAIGGLFAYRYWGELKGLFSKADEPTPLLSWKDTPPSGDGALDLGCPNFVNPEATIRNVSFNAELTNYGEALSDVMVEVMFVRSDNPPVEFFTMPEGSLAWPGGSITSSNDREGPVRINIGAMGANETVTIRVELQVPLTQLLSMQMTAGNGSIPDTSINGGPHVLRVGCDVEPVEEPPAPLVCAPATQNAAVGQQVSFTATGGQSSGGNGGGGNNDGNNGGGAAGQYQWSAPGGSPATGTGGSFTTSYTTTGSKTVTVTFNGQTATCTVTVSAQYQSPYASPYQSPYATPDTYATPTTPNADLSLTKSVNNNKPLLNSNVVFTVTVTNGGPANAGNVTVKDILPTGLTFVSANASVGSYNQNNGTWTVGALNVGASATLQLTVTATQVGSITNTAEVCTSDKPDPDSTPCNNVASEDDQDSASITVEQVQGEQKADLSLTKTVSDETPDVDTDVIYSIVVTNTGPDDATGVTVKDILPTGVTYKSHTASKGTYNNTSGIWTVGGLNVGASASLLITVTVTQSGSITNIAEVCASSLPDPDSTPCNNIPTEDDQDSVTINPPSYSTPYATPDSYSTPYSSPYATPGSYSTPYGTPYGSPSSGGSSPRADLSLTKVVNNTQPLQNEHIVYTVSVTNRGPSTANDVTVKDILPSGVVFVRFTTTAGNYDKATGIWTVGTLSRGGAASLQITVRVDRIATITNIAEVCSSDKRDPDSTPCNNVPTEDDYGTATFTTKPGIVLPAAGSPQANAAAVGLASIFLASVIFFIGRSRGFSHRTGGVAIQSITRLR